MISQLLPRLSYYLILLLAALLLALLQSPLFSAAENTGSSQTMINAYGSPIKIFLFRPSCSNPSILFVFHGLNRRAKRARDNAINIAKISCLMVFAPLFDKDSFPNWRYHRAGVVRHGQVQPRSRWTAKVLTALLDFSRQHVANPNAKIYLFGHSAGGQFLSRSFAYSSFPDVERVVIANPSVYVEPTLDVDAPYGLAGVFDQDQAIERLNSYLSSPISIYIGTKDTGDKYLVQNHMANRQGRNRYDRGRHIFSNALSEAERQNTLFRWRLVEACGIGHSSAGMLNAAEIRHALGLSKNKSSRQHRCAKEHTRHDIEPAKNGTHSALKALTQH
ncbi:MAG: hypothetical protein P8166_04385 [Candidatus Thiodiazotropha sp.]